MTTPETWHELCAVLAARLAWYQRYQRYTDDRTIRIDYEEIESAPTINVVWHTDKEFVEIEVER